MLKITISEAHKEMEGLCGGLMIEEVPDRRELTDMRHVQPGHGRGLVVGANLQRPVQLPGVTGISGAARTRWFMNANRTLLC